MRIGTEIDDIRKMRGLSIIDMCNIFNVSEKEYCQIISGRYVLSTFQLIMFISAVCMPLESVRRY